jgi:hypothetical protein
MSIKNLWRKKGLHSCSFISQLVGDKCKVFFPDGCQQYDIVQDQDTLPTARRMKNIDVFVVYFPSRSTIEPNALYQAIVADMRTDAVIIVVDISPDKIGQAMCRWGDEMKMYLDMSGVFDQIPYRGSEALLMGTDIMTGQFWGKQSDRSVSLGDLVTY